MKRKTHSTLTLAQVIGGYELAAQARHLSPHTLADYANTFQKLRTWFVDDPPFSSIDHHQIQAFLAAQTTVSNKTLLNYHTGLSALWTWAVSEGLVTVQVLHQVARPKPEITALVPFSEADVRAMLGSLGQTKSYTRPGNKGQIANTIPSAERNRAILLLLLDTGMRASELCGATIANLDNRNRRIKVFGKGAKERFLPFSARTGQAVWKYVMSARKGAAPTDPLFVTAENNPMDRDRLCKLIANIGERAGVAQAHPHRFRHTFSINYLRNGGDPWSLQMMLGHTTMEMVRRYLAIAQADLEAGHRRASPVDNWRL